MPANRKPYKLFIIGEATVISIWKYALGMKKETDYGGKTTECQYQGTI